MSRLTREQRIRRQVQDDGDPDDRVWIAKDEAGTYHNEKECARLKVAIDPRPETRRGAQCRWMAPCKECVPGVDLPSTQTAEERHGVRP